MEVQEAYKAYKKIKKYNIQDQIDQRILAHLDQDLRNLFESLIEIDSSNNSCEMNDVQNLNQSKYQNIITTYKTHEKPQIKQSN